MTILSIQSYICIQSAMFKNVSKRSNMIKEYVPISMYNKGEQTHFNISNGTMR